MLKTFNCYTNRNKRYWKSLEIHVLSEPNIMMYARLNVGDYIVVAEEAAATAEPAFPLLCYPVIFNNTNNNYYHQYIIIKHYY